MFRFPAILALLCPLAACSPGNVDPPPPEPVPAATPTVVDTQLRALDKARAVEQQLEEQKQRTDQAIEDQGG